MIAEFDFGGLTSLLVAVIGALAAALATLIPIYFRSKRGEAALAEAIDEAGPAGATVREALKKKAEADPKLGAHLDGVKKKAETKRLEGGAE